MSVQQKNPPSWTISKCPLKVPCWLNMLGTGEKYCKRYTLPELKKVKIRNSKFELLVVKFISLHYFSSYIFERGIFCYLEESFNIEWGNWGNYCSVSFHSAGSKLNSLIVQVSFNENTSIWGDQKWIWPFHLCKLPFRQELWSFVNCEVLSADYEIMRVTHSVTDFELFY